MYTSPISILLLVGYITLDGVTGTLNIFWCIREIEIVEVFGRLIVSIFTIGIKVIQPAGMVSSTHGKLRKDMAVRTPKWLG